MSSASSRGLPWKKHRPIESEEVEMRDIVAVEFVSVDGVVESPETWTPPYFDDEIGQAMQEGMDASDAMLLGRRTYEEFVSYWPDKTAEDDPIAPYINETQKFVVSRTLTSVEWRNSALIKGDVVAELARLKQQPGKNIGIVGSPTLVRSLLRDGLLDRLELLLFPIVVGKGKRLFEDEPVEAPLVLVDSHAFKTGVVSLSYEPAGKERR
jgi:dihydrofolate reductase